MSNSEEDSIVPAPAAEPLATLDLTRISRVTALGIALAVWVGPLAAAAQARVETFSPKGSARHVRQVSARFSEPIVPLGDPRSTSDPFAIECAAKGSSRWADSHTWVHTFEQDLPAGLRCRFTLQAGLRSLAGNAVKGQEVFEFSTGGPAIVEIYPRGGSIAEDQRFAVRLDALPTPQSFEQHAFVQVAGLPDPIGLRLVEGAEREAVLAGAFWRRDNPNHLVLEARQRFAPRAKVALHWGPGIAAESGVATGVRQSFEFDVRAPFSVKLGCQRERGRAGCVPIAPIRLEFSAPVAWDAAGRITLRAVDEAHGPRSWPARRASRRDGDPLVDRVEFAGPFPPGAEFRVELPSDLFDDTGRRLEPGVAERLELRTDRYPPLAKFASRFGIVEAASPLLPLALRHVSGDAKLRGVLAAQAARLDATDPARILDWLGALERREWIHRDQSRSIFSEPALAAATPRELELPAVEGSEAGELIGIPLQGTGLHVLEIESRVLGEALLDTPAPMYVSAGALVTNLAVHFKWGDESSLVWVTRLDRGEPVAGARITVADCRGSALARSTTDEDGIARIAELPAESAVPRCDDRSGRYGWGLLVIAESAGDLGIVHTSWNRGIEPWRFGLPTEWRPRRDVAHTIFDRALVRAGETVHMKHVLRRAAQTGFAQHPPEDRPRTLRIKHEGSDDRWDLPLEWVEGGALTDWAVPPTAKLGTYRVSLLPRSGPEWLAQETGSFRVEEFRVPLMRATIRTPDEALVTPSELPLDIAVQFLAGGGAVAWPVTLRTHVRKHASVHFPGWSEFELARGGIAEGVRRRSFGESWLGEHEWYWGEEGSLGLVWRTRTAEGGGRAAGPVATQQLTLDAAGTARAVVPELPRADAPLEAQVEIELRDPNGEIVTSSRSVSLWPADRVIGLQAAPGPHAPGEPLRVRAVVLDLEGNPRWRAKLEVDAYERRSYAARKRIVGGFYAYENVEEVRRLGRFCSGRTDWRGTFRCEGAPPSTGQLVLVARTRDGEDRESVTHTDVWVAGDDDWFAQSASDRMDLFPERRRYEPGQKARFEARLPFREATALVSIEREGVGETFVTRLTSRRPFIEVPVRASHAPNVFVSVLAVRGRAAEPPPTAVVDLARPAYRLGVAEVRVGGRENELAVRVIPERRTYRVRETARVKLEVRTPRGKAPPAGSEVALAVVDEGLLELAPNPSWKLLDAMLGRRSYGVRTATAQMQVVGKRHFGRKAVPSGGGGGQLPTRELFDTLLLWRGRVPLDAGGDASVEVPLNDSLTSFHIAALATAGEHLFGSGEASIRTTQDLMLFSGLPPLVREGDRFAAGFTLRNATENARRLTLRAQVDGLPQALEPIAVELAAGEARELGWDVQVPVGVNGLTWNVEVGSAEGSADRLRASERISPAVPERVLQASLIQVQRDARIEVERPADALEGRGGVALALRPRLADGRDGIERILHAYPHTCLEQRASVAVALRDAERWRATMNALPSHLDSDGLARFFPTARSGSEVLTAYLLAIAHEASWEIPALQRERMLEALVAFVEGRILRTPAAFAADLPLRKLAALEALARYGRATPELVGSVAVDPRLLTNGGLLDWISVLERVPQIRDRAAKLSAADLLLRARLDVQGTALGFARSRGGLVDWLLATSDVNAARLVLSRLAQPGWRSDTPRLMRALLALQREGAWPTTTANAWGVLALEKFSAAYERTPVTGSTRADLAAASEQVAWSAAPGGESFRLGWPTGRSSLALVHSGSGAPWATLQSIAALPLRTPLESGYRIRKRWEPVLQRIPGQWSRGDVARVRLEIESYADASWVAVSDPIPAGATILGRGLGGDSQLLAGGERASGWAWEAFRENSQEAHRRYYEWVPKGSFSLEYTVRLNQVGEFGLPPTRVEALYAPERMGELPNPPIEVLP